MRRLLYLCAALSVAASCVRKSTLIPAKAILDLNCPKESLTIMPLTGADEGPHLVTGCGRKATYELSPIGDWALTDAVTNDPVHIMPEQSN
ncbi:MAG: hypothetical protein ACT4TC_02520 [Myxococcaceae bacterium]